LAAQPRPVRFVLFSGAAPTRWLGRLLRWTGASAADVSTGPGAVEETLRGARAALARGELVCLFSGGHRTRDGTLWTFRQVFELVNPQASAAVIPVCLDQVWGSLFGQPGGRA